MATVTKTLNRLPFNELEPHRFEDLVRQLIYDHRNWYALEALGRSGDDEGIDIRGTERVDHLLSGDDEEEDGPVRESAVRELLWFLQCKRYKRLHPKHVKEIVEENIAGQSEPPYGYGLVSCCDFSKKSRDTFRTTVLAFSVAEYFIWGRAELEDLLFLPKNDHLLFAYFGISLQVRRRSIRTRLRANLTLKKKLAKVFGDLRQDHHTSVLIRDPRDSDYPHTDRVDGFLEAPRWRYWVFHRHRPKDGVFFIARKCPAWLDTETERWDALFEIDESMPHHPELYEVDRQDRQPSQHHHELKLLWHTEISKRNKGWFYEFKWIPYDRILAIDEVGDDYNDGPHLLVDFLSPGMPFERGEGRRLVILGDGLNGHSWMEADPKTRHPTFEPLMHLIELPEEPTDVQTELERHEASLLNLKGEYIDLAVQLVRDKRWSTARSLVGNKPELIGSMSESELVSLKTQLATLNIESEEDIRKALNEEALWWDGCHTLWITTEATTDGPEEDLDKQLRLLVGQSGPLLENAGLLPKTGTHGVWRERDESGRYHPRNARPIYPYRGLSVTPKMRQLREEYARLARRCRRLKDHLPTDPTNTAPPPDDNPERQDALALWDAVGGDSSP